VKLDSIVLKTGDIMGHLASAGLALDSVYNVSQGNHELAAVEAMISAYVQLSKSHSRKRKQLFNELAEITATIRNLYIPQLQKINEQVKGHYM
jgi:hypothetical protein